MSTGLYMSTQLDVGLFPVFTQRTFFGCGVIRHYLFLSPQTARVRAGCYRGGKISRIRFPPQKKKVHYYDRRKLGFKADVQDALTIAG